ncbi:competence protein [Nitratireductor aestuarii]|uniref:Competence protein n=1 Tax=Nitratireductor aestuarii TaxID=1735103 RepID=A0A916RG08_9HYPH|nr:ComEC/Rec2 family competence protein [Nitratireductor aestuarii]GGA55115.1 competence protein [Nitratireductor aestuarii]
MSINLSGPAVDERAQFAQAELSEHASVLVPRASQGVDLPATRPSVQLRPWAIERAARTHAWLKEQCATELARGAGFLCLPVFLGAGAVLYYALPEEPGAIALVSTAACLGILVWLARQRSLLFFVLAALLTVVLGSTSAKMEVWRASTPMLGSDIATRITGRVVRIEHQATGRVRLTLDVMKTERPTLRYAPERVRITARKIPENLRSGDVVEGFARLLQPSGPVRPGGYDFAFGNYFSGLGATGFFLTDVVPVADDQPPTILERPMRTLESIREALADRIRQHVSGPEGEVAVALITGYRAGIPEEMNEALRRSGLAHVLSISGLHMALVAGTVMLMIRFGCALFPVFSSSFPVKKFASLAALLFCTLYLSLSGADVAAQRSYFMLAVMLVATLFDRAAISMRNVAIAATVILIVAPHEVIGPSFQMSFAATAALVAGYAAWTEWRSSRLANRTPPSSHVAAKLARYMLAAVGGLALTSIIAGTATAIYGIWHFQRATPLSLPSNLVAMPAISAVVMPCAVLAILALPFGLEGFFLKTMQWGISVMVDVATWFSERTPVDAVGLLPLGGMLWFTAALLVLVGSTTRLRLLALPLAAFGFAAVMERSFPDVMITEDARLVAIRGEGGTLAVNRPRPSGIAIDDWKRALASETVVTPQKGSVDATTASDRFICEEGVCLARHDTGALIVQAQKAGSVTPYCTQAAIIVVEDATVEHPCGDNQTAVVLTGRDLARRGSAAIYLSERGSGPRLVQAIDEPWRPWHEYRAFSRASRGLPPPEKR